MRRLLLLCGLVLAQLSIYAQPYEPTRSEIMDRYRRAHYLDSIATRSIFKATVRPHWSADYSSFWYRNILKDSAKEYIFVDMAHGTRKKLDAEPADTIYRNAPFRRYTGRRWASFSTDSLSPDKKWVAFVRDGNVFVREATASREEAFPFTRDGDAGKSYGDLAWSPDSKYLVGYHIDPVKDSSVYYVLSSVSGTTRGQLRSRPYKQPGDPFTTYEMFIFRLEGRKTTKVNTPLVDFFGAPELHWRNHDSRYFLFERVERGDISVSGSSSRWMLKRRRPGRSWTRRRKHLSMNPVCSRTICPKRMRCS